MPDEFKEATGTYEQSLGRMERPLTVWITKYALTSGIQERTVKEMCGNGMVSLVPLAGEYGGIYYHKPYWHSTKEKAIAHAKTMQAKKIASLKKQLKKIEALHFE